MPRNEAIDAIKEDLQKLSALEHDYKNRRAQIVERLIAEMRKTFQGSGEPIPFSDCTHPDEVVHAGSGGYYLHCGLCMGERSRWGDPTDWQPKKT